MKIEKYTKITDGHENTYLKLLINCEKQGQWMNVEVITLSKLTVTKKEKKRNTSCSLSHADAFEIYVYVCI